jgi:hypothetical protein
MSGYLQRLVQGAVNSGGSAGTRSIRPVLGSIYSAPPLSSFPAAFPEDIPKLEAVKEKEPEAFEQRSEASERSHQDAHLVRLEDSAKESTPHISAVPPSEIHPVQAPAVQTQAPNPERAHDNRDSRQSTPISQPAASFQPLVTANYMRTAAEAVSTKSFDTFISARKGKNTQDLSNRLEPAAKEADEVQIHIGRIEVTAAPPPQAARPAQKSLRKSINLEEFLKRSGRRGG